MLFYVSLISIFMYVLGSCLFVNHIKSWLCGHRDYWANVMQYLPKFFVGFNEKGKKWKYCHLLSFNFAIILLMIFPPIFPFLGGLTLLMT